MYREFFGLKQKPFTLSPDPDFFYFSKSHHLAFTHLEYGLVHNIGYMALTGDSGAGKTTLLRYLIKRIKAPISIAMIFNTLIDSESFLEMVVKEFHISPPSNRKSDLYDSLYTYFIEQHNKKKRCVIFIDESQNLKYDVLEELRMLSNFETGVGSLVQIVLAGQSEFRNRLTHPSLEQLTQRIAIHYHLTPLQLEDVSKYIKFRLHVAGLAQNNELFEKDAIILIAEMSNGIPRIINSICDLSLTYACSDLSKTVTGKIVESVISNNEMLRRGNRANTGYLIDAPCNGNSTDYCESKGGLGGDKNSVSLDLSAFGGIMSDLAGRLSVLEERVVDTKVADLEHSIGIVQKMLVKEREKNSQLTLQLQDIKQKYKKALKAMQKTREQNSAEPEPPAQRFRIPWKPFNFLTKK